MCVRGEGVSLPAGMKIQSAALSVLHVQGTWVMSAYLNMLIRSMSSSDRPAPLNGPSTTRVPQQIISLIQWWYWQASLLTFSRPNLRIQNVSFNDFCNPLTEYKPLWGNLRGWPIFIFLVFSLFFFFLDRPSARHCNLSAL